MIRGGFAVLLLLLAVSGCGGGGNGGGGDRGNNQPVLGASGDEEQGSTAQALGFPIFATKNTTRVAGADAIANAAGVARAVYPARTEESSPKAVVIVDQGDWRSAISAAQLMARPLRAPILLSDGGEMPAASEEALEELAPSGADQLDGAQVIRIGDAAAKPDNRRIKDVPGASSASLAEAIDKLQAQVAGDPTSDVLVAPADSPEFAMPAAGWAARSGDPVLWTLKDSLPAETKRAIQAHPKARIYVLGPEEAISATVIRELEKLGRTKRISGPDAVQNAIAFARFSDGALRLERRRPRPRPGVRQQRADGSTRPPARRSRAAASTARCCSSQRPARCPSRCRSTCSTSSRATTRTRCAGSTITAGSWATRARSRGTCSRASTPSWRSSPSTRKASEMAQAEQPERLRKDRAVTVDDVRQLMGSSTPHFALQLRNRIARLIAGLPPDDPARLLGEHEIARLESLAFTGEVRGEGYQDGQRLLPSVNDHEQPRHVPRRRLLAARSPSGPSRRGRSSSCRRCASCRGRR